MFSMFVITLISLIIGIVKAILGSKKIITQPRPQSD
ncbi:MAG: hypothetical protein MJB12_02350 [Firmicutes bacterium]|nr:hypothetical protein [Bacillota bacterium]